MHIVRGRSRIPCIMLLAAVVTLACPPPAEAQEEALALFKQGRALVEQNRWAEACPLFAEAHRIQRDAIGITLNLADCYKRIGKTASAWTAYQEAEFLAKKQRETEKERYARAGAAEMEPRLSRLQINAVATPGLVIRRDDQEVGQGMIGVALPVDPGEHKIEATAPGYLVWSTSVRIGPERDSQAIQIPALQQGAGGVAGPWGAQRISGIVLAGAGVAGAVVGAVFGAQAISKKNASNANGHCDASDACDAMGLSLRSDSIRAGNVSTGLFVAGGALLTAGLVVFFTAPSGAARAPATGVVVGPGTLALTGRW